MQKEIIYYELNYYTEDGAHWQFEAPASARKINIMKSENKQKLEDFCKQHNIVLDDMKNYGGYNEPYEKYFIEEIIIVRETEAFNKKALAESERLLKAAEEKKLKKQKDDEQFRKDAGPDWPFNLFN